MYAFFDPTFYSDFFPSGSDRPPGFLSTNPLGCLYPTLPSTGLVQPDVCDSVRIVLCVPSSTLHFHSQTRSPRVLLALLGSFQLTSGGAFLPDLSRSIQNGSGATGLA